MIMKFLIEFYSLKYNSWFILDEFNSFNEAYRIYKECLNYDDGFDYRIVCILYN